MSDDILAAVGPQDFSGKLPANQLFVRTELTGLAFETTASLDQPKDMVGQDRALRALEFGSKVRSPGFNVFVIGSATTAMRQAVKVHLEAEARSLPTPSDWVYVNNFALSHKPTAIELPAGRAADFRDGMQDLVQDLKVALPAAFESAEYQSHRDMIDEKARHAQENAFTLLRDKAIARKIAILRTPMGFGLVPLRDGKPVPPDEFAALPEAERQSAEQAIHDLEPELEQTIRALPRLEKERRDALRELDQQTVQVAVGQTIAEARRRFADLPRILTHLDMIRQDLIENVALFVNPPAENEIEASKTRPGGAFDRYEVNILVSRSERSDDGAPVIEELHPTLGNLTGRVEHLALQGMLLTNFRLVKAGVLHRANGGFLLIDARSLLMEPYSWPALKRALLQRQILIEDLAHSVGLSSTVTLEPDPIPLDVKVILFGDRSLYYLLSTVDPEVAQQFKVLADFEDDVSRTPTSEEELARAIASIIRREGLRHVEKAGVERMLEHAARLAGDREKLSLVTDQLRDLVVEASFETGRENREVVTRADVERAIDAQEKRAGRLQQHARESVRRGIALIDTQGRRDGQINGLSVLSLGGYSFGTATRITCRVRPGAGKIVDIEREVELGGPIHSKGVLILSGFLAGRYALDAPMSLFASIVFEQSYGGVEGDSASAAELCALLSALSATPLRQECAMTGSVNQHGEIQAIGGVNEKIEGFFEICRARGLTGSQCVLIPASNVQHLMLKREVVDACAKGDFAVYAVRRIDEAIEVLTGAKAGERDANGKYPDDSINGLVENRLKAFAKARREPRSGADETTAES